MPGPDPPAKTETPAAIGAAQRAAAERAGWLPELQAALDAATVAADVIRTHYARSERGLAASGGWEKSRGNPVTQADLDADAAIRQQLGRRFPDIPLRSEEDAPGGADDAARLRDATRFWVVDPLDGTHEFVDRVPEFAVAVALVDAGEPVVAAVVNPLQGPPISAVRGAGTWRGAQRVHVTPCARIEHATALASRSETARGDWDAFRDWFARVERLGSIAWKLAAVACGVGDFNVSVRPKHAWDVCAADLLLREAGGRYCGADGQPLRYAPGVQEVPGGMAAGAPALVERFFERVARDPSVLAPASRARAARGDAASAGSSDPTDGADV